MSSGAAIEVDERRLDAQAVSLHPPWPRADRERMTRKVKDALIQVAGVAGRLSWFAPVAAMNKLAGSTVIGLVIGVALIVAGGRLYRWDAKVRNPKWKPSKSFHLSR